MITKRPINLNPLSIRLPLSAWVSITHRLSGLLIFILMPLLLWALDMSLGTEAGYLDLVDAMSQPWLRGLLFVFVGGLLFHLIAGVRHLLMDMQVGESLKVSRMSAGAVVIIAAIFILYALYLIWG